jgi:hypothetical protein
MGAEAATLGRDRTDALPPFARYPRVSRKRRQEYETGKIQGLGVFVRTVLLFSTDLLDMVLFF